MAVKSSADFYDKGSILPSVLGAERDLREREEAARRRAAGIVDDAKRRGERIIEQCRQRLPELEAAEQAALLDSVDERVEEIRRHEKADIRKLESVIEWNKARAIELIVSEVVPSWSGQLPHEKRQG